MPLSDFIGVSGFCCLHPFLSYAWHLSSVLNSHSNSQPTPPTHMPFWVSFVLFYLVESKQENCPLLVQTLMSSSVNTDILNKYPYKMQNKLEEAEEKQQQKQKEQQQRQEAQQDRKRRKTTTMRTTTWTTTVMMEKVSLKRRSPTFQVMLLDEVP